MIITTQQMRRWFSASSPCAGGDESGGSLSSSRYDVARSLKCAIVYVVLCLTHRCWSPSYGNAAAAILEFHSASGLRAPCVRIHLLSAVIFEWRTACYCAPNLLRGYSTGSTARSPWSITAIPPQQPLPLLPRLRRPVRHRLRLPPLPLFLLQQPPA